MDPALPSTVTIDAVLRSFVACGTANTAGMPTSRTTIAAWESTPPVSVTTAAAKENNGVHAGSVVRHTMTSPASTEAKSAGPRMSRTGPDAMPGLAGSPTMVLPSTAGCRDLDKLGSADVIGRACRIQMVSPLMATWCVHGQRSTVNPGGARPTRCDKTALRRQRSSACHHGQPVLMPL